MLAGWLACDLIRKCVRHMYDACRTRRNYRFRYISIFPPRPTRNVRRRRIVFALTTYYRNDDINNYDDWDRSTMDMFNCWRFRGAIVLCSTRPTSFDTKPPFCLSHLQRDQNLRSLKLHPRAVKRYSPLDWIFLRKQNVRKLNDFVEMAKSAHCIAIFV